MKKLSVLLITGIICIGAIHFNSCSKKDDTDSTTGGSDIIFNPNLTYGSVSDNAGNTYKTILIGTQTWMAENLKTIKYNDGTAIPIVTDGTAWAALSTPGYCWFNNDAAMHKATFGALYNWYTVNTGKLCPTGWHVPTDAEWTTLTSYLGGESVAGGKLKETGITHWQSPNTGATNESGFTALPGDYRGSNGSFTFGNNGLWWSTTDGSPGNALGLVMNEVGSYVIRSEYNKKEGFSGPLPQESIDYLMCALNERYRRIINNTEFY